MSDKTIFSALRFLRPKGGRSGCTEEKTALAMAMAMAHVIVKEFYIERSSPYFTGYAKSYTDLPFLVVLEERDGHLVPGRFLRASDLGMEANNAD